MHIMNKLPRQWQLQEAKNKLSQLIKIADSGAPQFISVHGRNTAVLLSFHEYQRLTRPANKLSSALLMPLLDESEDDLFERNPDTGRTIDL